MRLVLLALLGLARAQASSPEELAGLWRSQLSPLPAVVDPFGFLGIAAKNSMLNKMAGYFPGFRTAFFVFRAVDSRYRNRSGNVDIVRFGDDLLGLMFPDSASKNSALLILYAIDDRSYTIRTGSQARYTITDSIATAAAQAVVPYVQRQDYNTAFPMLLDELYNRSRSSGTGSIWPLIILFLILGPLICCCCMIGMCRGNPNNDYYNAPAATPFSQQQPYGNPQPYNNPQSNYGGTAGGWGNQRNQGNQGTTGGTAGGW